MFGAVRTPAMLVLSCVLLLAGCADKSEDLTPDEDLCEEVVCDDNASCDAATGLCGCDAGFELEGEQCVEGENDTPATACRVDAECDDGLACNGKETCDTARGECLSGEAVVCGDNATCDESSGACDCDAAFVEIDGQCELIACEFDADCDDGFACNGEETCNTETNSCEAGTAVECDGLTRCDEDTLDCLCPDGFDDFGNGCEVIRCSTDRDCDDGNPCNGVESCDLQANACVHSTPVVCEAFNEICDSDTGDCGCPSGYRVLEGQCEQIRCTEDADCDNGLLCDGEEVCDLETNRCLPGENVLCGNNQDCSEDDGSCACKPGFAPNDAGNCVAFCTEDIQCGEPSICGTTQVCNLDNNRCVNDEELCGPGSVCDPLAPEGERCQCAVGFKFDDDQDRCVAIGTCTEDADCDDGIFCNGAEECGANGRCVGTSFSPLFVGSVLCPIDGFCSEDLEECVCKDGYIMVDEECVPEVCTEDADCNDGIFCNGEEICDVANNQCVTGEAPTCGADERCHEGSQSCSCALGFKDVGGDCVAIDCETDSDCDNGGGGLCDGVLVCNTESNTCEANAQVDCGTGFCIEDEGETYCQCGDGEALVDGKCALACPVPQAPVMTIIQKDAVLNFDAPAGYAIEIAELGATEDVANAAWSSAGSVDLAQANHNPLRIIARTSGNDCQTVQEFDWTYELVENYPSTPRVGNQRNLFLNAIPAYLQRANGSTNESLPLNPIYKAWATGFEDLQYGTQNDSIWRKPEKVYGRPRGTFGVIVLGNDGRITLTFDKPITNGPGPDFAVFENGFISGSGVNAEVAYVEVSSDGKTFLRFDTHCLVEENPGGYGTMPPHLLNNLPGIQPAYYGTPFDLSELRNRPEVLNGTVDLERITHVRIIDIVGDRDNYDSFGNVIHDATPTFGSGGFDLDTVGVINVYEDTP